MSGAMKRNHYTVAPARLKKVTRRATGLTLSSYNMLLAEGLVSMAGTLSKGDTRLKSGRFVTKYKHKKDTGDNVISTARQARIMIRASKRKSFISNSFNRKLLRIAEQLRNGSIETITHDEALAQLEEKIRGISHLSSHKRSPRLET